MQLSWFQVRGPIVMRGWVCIRGGSQPWVTRRLRQFLLLRSGAHQAAAGYGIGGGGKFALIYPDRLCEDGTPRGRSGKTGSGETG